MRRYVDISELDIPSDDCSYDELVRFVEAVCESEYIGDIDLADDGTLSVKIDDATRVARVLVEDGENGDLYYTDGGDYEWCHDCKEYDTEKHCCPRFNKVIRQTVAELEADRSERWISCSERLPEIGQKVLASTKKTVFTQVFKGYHSDPKRWAWENNSIKRIEAWQPLPTPWKGVDDD